MFGRSPSDRPRPLDKLVAEVRAEEGAEPDWDAIQHRVFQQIRRQEVEAERRVAHGRASWFWPTLAVAVGAVALMLRAGSIETQIAPQAELASSPASVDVQAVATDDQPSGVDGDSLRVGARIQASGTELTVHHRGHVDWTLSPHSIATLVAVGEVVTIQLDEGSVKSKVVPVHAPESFSVLAAETRVSVHGTVFTVTLQGGQVDVDVEEGVVGVGPLTPKEEQLPTLLKAPAQGLFEAGQLVNDAAQQRLAAAAPRKRSQSVARTTNHEASAGPSKDWQPPSEAWSSAYNAAIARVEAGIGQCFGKGLSGAPTGVSIRATTNLTLRVTPSGAVLSADFSPPLAPGVANCSEQVIEATTFPRSPEGSHLSHSLQLVSGTAADSD